jgi:hypothetical protein
MMVRDLSNTHVNLCDGATGNFNMCPFSLYILINEFIKFNLVHVLISMIFIYLSSTIANSNITHTHTHTHIYIYICRHVASFATAYLFLWSCSVISLPYGLKKKS